MEKVFVDPVEFERREAAEHWAETARSTYEAFSVSGQARFYQPSDWALLWLMCDELDQYQSAAKRNGQILAAILSGFSSLLATEGDRRRLQIELASKTDDAGESPGVVEMQKWRQRLSS